MEPKKAQLAITMTVIAAVLVIAVCLFFLIGPDLGGSKSNTKPVAAYAPAAAQVVPAPQETEAPEDDDYDFSWVIIDAPGPDLLKGASEKLQRPKIDNYLSSYEKLYVYPEFVDEENGDEEIDFAYLLYEADKKLYSRHVIIELPKYTPVLGIAKQNGYTLVLVQPGVVGWVRTELLEYTGIYVVN